MRIAIGYGRRGFGFNSRLETKIVNLSDESSKFQRVRTRVLTSRQAQ